MAEFKVIGERQLGTKEFRIENNTLWMNGKGTVRFSFARADVEIIAGNGSRQYQSFRGVIETPDGAVVLPYFKTKDGWQIAMVEQFRISIPAKTTEAVGGEVDFADPQSSMSKELEEEIHISLAPKRIKVVFREYGQPSMFAACMWGGIVEINENEIPRELILGGEWQFGEYTVLVIKSLSKMLKARDAGQIVCDLYTSRLLDEVAKKVGLLEKKY